MAEASFREAFQQVEPELLSCSHVNFGIIALEAYPTEHSVVPIVELGRCRNCYLGKSWCCEHRQGELDITKGAGPTSLRGLSAGTDAHPWQFWFGCQCGVVDQPCVLLLLINPRTFGLGFVLAPDLWNHMESALCHWAVLFKSVCFPLCSNSDASVDCTAAYLVSFIISSQLNSGC